MESSTAIPKLMTKIIAVEIFKSIPNITITAAVISKGTTLGIIEISVILKDLNNKPTIRPISAIAKINPSITLLETFSVFKSNKCPEPVILNCSKFVSMFSAT